MTCPQCGSSDIRASRSTRWNDVFQRMLGREAARCRRCRRRFFVANATESGLKRLVKSNRTDRHQKLMSTRTRKRLIRQLIVISIFAVALIIFLFFLHYLTTERVPSQDSGAVRFPVASSRTQPV